VYLFPQPPLSGASYAFGSNSANVSWSFTRNAASQLLGETRDNDAYGWGGHAAFGHAYAVNGLNQYAGAGPAEYCHDANGNLTADGTHVYQYDHENRLVYVRQQPSSACPQPGVSGGYSGTPVAMLNYDPLGRLHQLRGFAGGVQTSQMFFQYDGDALVAEYDAAGVITQRYVHGADDPLVWYPGAGVEDSNARQLYADPRGSIVLVKRGDGTTVAINAYDGAAGVQRTIRDSGCS
jgi:hypothetical protein